MKKLLIEVCKEFILSRKDGVVINEPYIPYIPEHWNGVLVLAESQNLSSTNSDYVNLLKTMPSEKRLQRLGSSPETVGVYPWDDGSLKLAVEASLKVKASEVGVSNAVLWSQRGKKKQNVNPDLKLQNISSNIWSKLLPILNPTAVVCCGKIAQNVIGNSNWNSKIINLRLPAKTAMSRVSGMFNESDLLARYKEVEKIVKQNPQWVDGSYRLNKIFFACHAVSINTQI